MQASRLIPRKLSLPPEAGSRIRLHTELVQAIEHREFELFFQPRLDLLTMRVAGAEALIRWNHPTRQVLPPDDFLPFAEQIGLMPRISRWVTAAALSASQRLRLFAPSVQVCFNLSALDFSDELVIEELRAAAGHGVQLSTIGIELSPTAALKQLGTAADIVRGLRHLGVTVATYFGTGFSSASVVARLAVDAVKIDRGFFGDLPGDSRDAAIADMIIAVGHEAGNYETIAVGVETDAELTWLRRHRCRYAQGNAIAPPMTLDAFVRWLPTASAPGR